MTSLFALILLSISSNGAHAVPRSCATELRTQAVTAERCAIPELHQDVVNITVHRAGRSSRPTVIKALFLKTSSPAGQKLWSRLWVDSGPTTISTVEQDRLRKVVFESDRNRMDPGALAVLDFLANFVEPFHPIENFDRPGGPNLYALSDYFTYTMICGSIGKPHEAIFTTDVAFQHRHVSVIGDTETRCQGRCGFGCPMAYTWRSSQYTQQCLNHDACRELTGSNFDQCTDEYWSAAFGYLIAPDCG